MIKLICFVLFGLFVTVSDLHAQMFNELKTWQLQKVYREAMLLNDYHTAADVAHVLVKRKPQSGDFAMALGKAQYLAKHYEAAYETLSAEFERHPYLHGEVAYYLAEINKTNKAYDKALGILRPLKTKSKRIPMGPISRAMVEASIAGCELAVSYRDTVVYTQVTPVSGNVNSMNIDFAPRLFDEKTLIYGTLTDDTNTKEIIGADFVSKRRFVVAEKAGNEWVRSSLSPPPPFYNYPNFDTGNGVFSIDKNRFYFTKCTRGLYNKYVCMLFMTELQNGVWTEPVSLGDEINKKGFTATQPAVGTSYDPTLEVVYFVSDRKGGAGGLDIWYTVYDSKTKTHAKPYNAGVYINTAGNEMAPFFDLESHTLFFSSTGWPSVGGLDIFYSKGELVNWQEAKNIGYPINSSYDDLGFFRNESGKMGFFVSNRPESLMSTQSAYCDDIFQFVESSVGRVLVTGQIKTQELSRLEGYGDPKVTKMQQQGVLANQLIAISQLSDTAASLLIKEVKTDETGKFQVWLDRDHDYRINVKDTLVVGGGFSFNTSAISDEEEIPLELAPVITLPDQPIEIKNIYYEFDKTELTQSAKASLDSTLLKLAQKYPEVIIKVLSHTDNVGNDKYNKRLSDKRAQSVVSYLVEKGIEKGRLRAEGFGESKPIAPNELPDGSDNPDGRSKNRRTEFIIVGLK